MRSHWLALSIALLAGCKKPAPRPDPDPQLQPHPVVSTVATPPPPVIILLDAAPPSSAAVAVVERLKRAQTADALTPLYAPKVTVNGATVAAADHVKKKLAAMGGDAKTTFGEVTAETTPDGKDTYARFARKVTDDNKGETKEYPMLVIVRDGVVVEESDDPPDWCVNKDRTTNTKTQPGFKLSAPAAVAAAKESKHYAEVKKRVPHLGADLFGFGCAKRCGVPRRECGYHFRMSDMESSDAQLVEWVYVDPVSKTLWWQEKDWKSEQLR